MLVLGVSLHHEPPLTLHSLAIELVLVREMVDAFTQDRLTSSAFTDSIVAFIENMPGGYGVDKRVALEVA